MSNIVIIISINYIHRALSSILCVNCNTIKPWILHFILIDVLNKIPLCIKIAFFPLFLKIEWLYLDPIFDKIIIILISHFGNGHVIEFFTKEFCSNLTAALCTLCSCLTRISCLT
uniref:Uncharacterized protein MANES_06G012400 n=1 Tax=Rhizophora mucronata TaxID=61149 RepID=A0A2P2KJ41_RHIMU